MAVKKEKHLRLLRVLNGSMKLGAIELKTKFKNRKEKCTLVVNGTIASASTTTQPSSIPSSDHSSFRQ